MANEAFFTRRNLLYITRFFRTLGYKENNARVVELADTPDLGSGAFQREGSSPFPGNGF